MKYCLLLGALLLCMIGCQSDAERLNAYWTGNWEVDSFHIEAQSISSPLVEGATEENLSTTYAFKSNGTFSQYTASNNDTSDGTWHTSALGDSLVLNYQYAATAPDKYFVVSRTDNTVHLQQHIGHLGTIDMHLKKKPIPLDK